MVLDSQWLGAWGVAENTMCTTSDTQAHGEFIGCVRIGKQWYLLLPMNQNTHRLCSPVEMAASPCNKWAWAEIWPLEPHTLALYSRQIMLTLLANIFYRHQPSQTNNCKSNNIDKGSPNLDVLICIVVGVFFLFFLRIHFCWAAILKFRLCEGLRHSTFVLILIIMEGYLWLKKNYIKRT